MSQQPFCAVCGKPVEPYARPAQPADPALCDACQRANQTRPKPEPTTAVYGGSGA